MFFFRDPSHFLFIKRIIWMTTSSHGSFCTMHWYFLSVCYLLIGFSFARSVVFSMYKSQFVKLWFSDMKLCFWFYIATFNTIGNNISYQHKIIRGIVVRWYLHRANLYYLGWDGNCRLLGSVQFFNLQFICDSLTDRIDFNFFGLFVTFEWFYYLAIASSQSPCNNNNVTTTM